MYWPDYFNKLMIFQAIDIFEIFVFSFVIYYFSIWLKNDKQKNLLATFYCTLMLFFIAHFANMIALTSLFIIFWPVVLTIFILIHQNTLQKNFIALKKINVAQIIQTSWLEVFMRSSLNALTNNKQVTAIIECKDSLDNYLQSTFKVFAPINKDLLDTLINSENFAQDKMIWVDSEGKIHAINVNWNIKNTNLWFNETNTELDQWQQDSIIFTSKLDAIAFRTYPEKHTVDIIMQGKIISDLTPNNALILLSQLIKKSEIKWKKSEKETHEASVQINKFKQPSA